MDQKKSVKKLRQNLGWSQFRLEQESNVGRNTIALHEQGYRQMNGPDYAKVIMILEAALRQPARGGEPVNSTQTPYAAQWALFLLSMNLPL